MFPQISVRLDPDCPNHHIWNNNGTWFIHYVIHPTPLTKKRVRCSLRTKDVQEARRLRDAFLAEIYRGDGITEVLDYGNKVAIRARHPSTEATKEAGLRAA